MREVFKTRYNIMNITSVTEFSNVKGGVNCGCKDVYFIRMIGTDAGLLQQVRKMDSELTRRMLQGMGRYKRISSLPGLIPPDEINRYVSCYQNWIDSRKTQLITKRAMKDKRFYSVLSDACGMVMERYNRVIDRKGLSIEKNYAVKLMFWLDFVLDGLITEWDEKMSVKIVADNVVSTQEYLFYYLLTLLGFDVLLLQTREDISNRLDDLGLSHPCQLGGFSEQLVPPYEESSCVESVEHDRVVSSTVAASQEPSVRVKIPRRPERENKQRDSVIKKADETGHRQEKTYEELAMLASSVVQIAIHDNRGEVRGTGSGIMVGRDGYILTNNHVASGGSYYSVRIEDDEQIYNTDEVIKYNNVLDLAIIRIRRTLNPLPIYDSREKLVRGQRVVAIGSPLGLFNSVSDGIVSGFRKFEDVDMIQFTAPISHGSSGGAVLNMYGEVIGISTAGFDDGQNINLAMGYECINAFVRGFI